MFKKLRYFFLVGLFIAGPAAADEQPFVKPTMADFMHMLASFNAINYGENPKLVDEYTMVTHCDYYTTAYGDEFKWRKIHDAMLDSINQLATTPFNKISYETLFQLDRYNFDDQSFHFTKNSKVDHVNAFDFDFEEKQHCGRGIIETLPHQYRAVIEKAFTIPGIPMSPETGEFLLKDMQIKGNTKRVIFGRFNLVIKHIQPLVRYPKYDRNGVASYYYLQGRFLPNPTQLDADLDSVEFFADQDMKIKLYTYKP